LRSLDALPHNLPLQLTSFVGRERELTTVQGLLAQHRLVTLTGPGGTGKTRLALQATAEALVPADGQPAFADGVWLVELAALADPAPVFQAVATALGVREEPGRPLLATLTDALRHQRLLLVLDNCEHLLDTCARLADAQLRPARVARRSGWNYVGPAGSGGRSPWRRA
jgi:predicted ATPase